MTPTVTVTENESLVIDKTGFYTSTFGLDLEPGVYDLHKRGSGVFVAYEPCDNCDGTGQILADALRKKPILVDPFLGFTENRLECPSCGGSGKQWPDWAVTQLMASHSRARRPWAREVLDALAEAQVEA